MGTVLIGLSTLGVCFVILGAYLTIVETHFGR